MSESAAEKLQAVLMFLVLSIAGGLLVAGLAVPTMLVGTSMINTGASDLDQMPLDLITPPQPQASKVYMADNSLLTTFSDEYREYVTLDKISPWMQKAQVAIEDKRFYEHNAVDPIGLIHVIFGHLTGQTDRGASSITQQYVKLVRVQVALQNGDTQAAKDATALTLSRKIVEMRYAMALEKKMSKDQILEGYLNIAYYGDQAYGVQAAAYHYFGVAAADLDLPQAAMLAGLVQAPGATSPTQHPEAATKRRNVVLNVMADATMTPRFRITPAQRDAAIATPWDPSGVQSITKGCQESRYPFICDYVWRTLTSPAMADEFGATLEARQNAVRTGGYTIHTVIDPVAQDSAQAAVSARIDPRDPAIGVMVMVQPGTGLIISMAQSRPVMGNDESVGQTSWNFAVPFTGADGVTNMGGMEGFQAGSTFKAFVLANALSLGISYDTMYQVAGLENFDGQTFMSCEGPFRQSKYSARGESGVFTLQDAIAHSVNGFFIKLERDTSICGAVKMAQAAGVKLSKPVPSVNPKDGTSTTDLIKAGYDQYPSFTLGVPEVAPLTMAAAYATFAAGGKHCDPIILQSVTDRDGNSVPVPDANCQNTIDPNIVAGVNQGLQAVMAYGTGSVARFGGWPLAGKSGTTTGPQALAFAGFTPYVAGYATIATDKKASWFFKGNPPYYMAHITLPYSKTYISGTGAPDAGKIWSAAMKVAVRDLPRDGFPAYIPIQGNWSSTNTYAPPPPPPPGQPPAPPPPT